MLEEGDDVEEHERDCAKADPVMRIQRMVVFCDREGTGKVLYGDERGIHAEDGIGVTVKPLHESSPERNGKCADKDRSNFGSEPEPEKHGEYILYKVHVPSAVFGDIGQRKQVEKNAADEHNDGKYSAQNRIYEDVFPFLSQFLGFPFGDFRVECQNRAGEHGNDTVERDKSHHIA